MQALLDGAVKVAGDKVFIVQDDKATDSPSRGEPASLPEAAEDVVSNNRMRGELDTALAALKLFSPDRGCAPGGDRELGKATPNERQLPLIDKALRGRDRSRASRNNSSCMRARRSLVAATDRGKRLAAAKELATRSQSPIPSLLLERLGNGGEADAEVRAALQQALRCGAKAALAWGERLGAIFSGIAWAPSCCWSRSAWRSPTA